MPNYQIIECMVALGGDDQQVIHRGHDSPVTLAEMIILQYIHGDESVTETFEIGYDERENTEEVDRLRRTYNAKPVADCFPGNRPLLPVRDGRIQKRLVKREPKRAPAPVRDDPFGDEPHIATEADVHDTFEEPATTTAEPPKRASKSRRSSPAPDNGGTDLDTLRAGE